jgi:LDH2 family malate/lactate/ureidoglycolate dehydrogenase
VYNGCRGLAGNMSRRIAPDVLHDFNVRVFKRLGVPHDDAVQVATARLESALRQPAGLDVFAVQRLHNTVRRLQVGGINPRPQITVVWEQAQFALVDGDNGLGAVVGTRSMLRCLQKARGQGLALVGVRNSTTLGMMAYYAMLALEHQAIGFVATNTELKIGLPPWGGVTPALGNNPFAIAIPVRQEPALVLDMSVIATQPQGSQDHTTHAGRARLGTSFVSRPVIGEHKGYGLALVLEVLTGVLTGAGFGQAHSPERLESPAAHHDLGHVFAVLEPSMFMPLEQFYTRMEQLRCEITQAERIPGVERIVVPGQLEYERRLERLQHGIPVHDEVPAVLRDFCASLDLDSPILA